MQENILKKPECKHSRIGCATTTISTLRRGQKRAFYTNKGIDFLEVEVNLPKVSCIIS